MGSVDPEFLELRLQRAEQEGIAALALFAPQQFMSKSA
jgi:hypothetical protein